MKNWTLVVLAASFALMANGKVYKWTDSEGRVQFGSSPPTGQQADQVKIHKAPAAPAPVSEPNAEGKEAETNPALPATRPQTGQLTDQQKQEMTKYCGDLRARLTQLQSGNRLSENTASGTRILSVEDIAQKVSADRSNIDTYCTANGL